MYVIISRMGPDTVRCIVVSLGCERVRCHHQQRDENRLDARTERHPVPVKRAPRCVQDNLQRMSVLDKHIDGRVQVGLECLLLLCTRLVELPQVNVVDSVRLMSGRVGVSGKECVSDWLVKPRVARMWNKGDAFGRRVTGLGPLHKKGRELV